jgi:hypothetical protein
LSSDIQSPTKTSMGSSDLVPMERASRRSTGEPDIFMIRTGRVACCVASILICIVSDMCVDVDVTVG